MSHTSGQILDYVGVLSAPGGEISNEIKGYAGIEGSKLSKNALGVDLGKIYFFTFTHKFLFFLQNFKNRYDHPGGDGWGGKGYPSELLKN